MGQALWLWSTPSKSDLKQPRPSYRHPQAHICPIPGAHPTFLPPKRLYPIHSFPQNAPIPRAPSSQARPQPSPQRPGGRFPPLSASLTEPGTRAAAGSFPSAPGSLRLWGSPKPTAAAPSAPRGSHEEPPALLPHSSPPPSTPEPPAHPIT